MRTSKKISVGSKLIVLNTKMTREDRELCAAKAKRWTKGNISAFVRAAVREYTPRKGEVIVIRPFIR